MCQHVGTFTRLKQAFYAPLSASNLFNRSIIIQAKFISHSCQPNLPLLQNNTFINSGKITRPVTQLSQNRKRPKSFPLPVIRGQFWRKPSEKKSSHRGKILMAGIFQQKTKVKLFSLLHSPALSIPILKSNKSSFHQKTEKSQGTKTKADNKVMRDQ